MSWYCCCWLIFFVKSAMISTALCSMSSMNFKIFDSFTPPMEFTGLWKDNNKARKKRPSLRNQWSSSFSTHPRLHIYLLRPPEVIGYLIALRPQYLSRHPSCCLYLLLGRIGSCKTGPGPSWPICPLSAAPRRLSSGTLWYTPY